MNFIILRRGDSRIALFFLIFSTIFRKKPLTVVKFSKTRLLTFVFSYAIIIMTIGPIVAKTKSGYKKGEIYGTDDCTKN